jgi:hypothetical protein
MTNRTTANMFPVLMTCCGTRYASVAHSMNHACVDGLIGETVQRTWDDAQGVVTEVWTSLTGQSVVTVALVDDTEAVWFVGEFTVIPDHVPLTGQHVTVSGYPGVWSVLKAVGADEVAVLVPVDHDAPCRERSIRVQAGVCVPVTLSSDTPDDSDVLSDSGDLAGLIEEAHAWLFDIGIDVVESATAMILDRTNQHFAGGLEWFVKSSAL